MKEQMIIMLILYNQMKSTYTLKQTHTNGKIFLNPIYNLNGFEQYLLPKLNNASIQHNYFEPEAINQLYKQKNIDPMNLQCNLKFDIQQYQKQQPKSIKSNLQQIQSNNQIIINTQRKSSIVSNPGRKKPTLRNEGVTHFIHVPFAAQLQEAYINQLKPLIQQEDQDLLQDLQTMHATILAFRMNGEEELQKWEKVLRYAKRTKVHIHGVDIFPRNGKHARVLYLNVKGLDDMADRIISKAIEEKLVQESQLKNIIYDKPNQSFRLQHPHITLLKTNNQDYIDAVPYLKKFSKLNLSKVPVKQVRLSIIGSYDGENYYDEIVQKL